MCPLVIARQVNTALLPNHNGILEWKMEVIIGLLHICIGFNDQKSVKKLKAITMF